MLDRHADEAGIIYCIRRSDVDEMAAALQRHGVSARRRITPASATGARRRPGSIHRRGGDIVVATIAFGMGIDRSNVRFVLHRGMPKSLEHYQQEAGRAGRDGLEAECVLLYSEDDIGLWEFIIDKAREKEKVPPQVISHSHRLLQEMWAYCGGTVCRHRALVEYFGQEYRPRSCGACDLCLGDARVVADSLIVAQKILSCVARLKEGWDTDHVVQVLLGNATEPIRREKHDALSTFGLLRGQPEAQIRDWIGQLHAQGLLAHERDSSGLRLTDESGVRARRPVKLLAPGAQAASRRPRRAWMAGKA